jgi:polysaccharide export outer membrane protein
MNANHKSARLIGSAFAIVASALVLLIGACTSPGPELPASLPESGVSEHYRIGPGNRLRVFVWGNPGLSDEVPVRPDGRISTPLLEDVEAADKTRVSSAARSRSS